MPTMHTISREDRFSSMSEVSEGWVTGGHMVDMARDLNGFIFYTEHRFYGLSRPTL
jgi:Serine carboxypeptidase S28